MDDELGSSSRRATVDASEVENALRAIPGVRHAGKIVKQSLQELLRARGTRAPRRQEEPQA